MNFTNKQLTSLISEYLIRFSLMKLRPMVEPLHSPTLLSRGAPKSAGMLEMSPINIENSLVRCSIGALYKGEKG